MRSPGHARPLHRGDYNADNICYRKSRMAASGRVPDDVRMAPALPPVLVVDDHAGLRSALCEALRGEGYDAIEAGDGHTALEMLRSSEPSVAIVDVRMPGMDGFTLLERMHQEQIDCPVILISVVGDIASRRQAERLGAFAFKEKPFDLRELLDDVRAATAS